MKKLISLLAVIALMTVLATVAFAADEPALLIKDVEAAPGAEVVMNIEIVNNPGMTLGEFVFEFDADHLEFVSGAAVGGDGWDWLPMVNTDVNNAKFGSVVFSASSQPLTGDAVLVTLTLKVKDDVKPGKYPVNAVVDFIGDDAADFITATTFTGYVVVPCTEHEWDEGTVKTPATCTEDGVMEYKCIYCGATKEEPIAAIGHAWGEWTVTTEPTCGVVGEETRTCANCGETEKREVAALEHKWVEVERVEATCFEDGKVTYKCELCGETKEEVLTAAGAHTWDEGVVKTEATCCTAGVKVYTCSACGETKEEEIAPNGEHTWNEGEVKTPATCCEDGVMLFTCVNGTATKEEVIPATGAHELGYTDNKDGKTHTVYCKNSNKVLDPAEVHTFVEGVCICGAVEVVPPTGDHSVIAVAFATLSMLGITAVVSKKKEF